MPNARPLPRAVMYAYPWDLEGPGAEATIDRLARLGVDGVQLAATYHVADFLMPRHPSARVRAGELGSLQFSPCDAPEVEWPFDPPVAPDADRPGRLARLVDALHDRDLDATAWIPFLYNHELVRARPELAVRNAWKDRNAAQLCPSNPAARSWARALATAVPRAAPFDAVHVESLSFLAYDYGFLNLKAAVVPDVRASLLLGLCFCAHCRARASEAGCDVDALADAVRSDVDAHLNALPDGAGPSREDLRFEDPGTDEAVRAFLHERERSATSLQLEILDLLGAAGLRLGSSSVEAPDPRVTGLAVEQVVPRLGELRIDATPGLGAPDPVALAARLRAHARPDVPLYATVQLSAFASESAFRAALDRLRADGIDRFRFYALGMASERQLGWIGRACGS